MLCMNNLFFKDYSDGRSETSVKFRWQRVKDCVLLIPYILFFSLLLVYRNQRLAKCLFSIIVIMNDDYDYGKPNMFIFD